MTKIRNEQDLSGAEMIAYAAPVTGSFFFYIPMLSILPGMYAKYFGLELSSVASVVFLIRLFDGISDPTIGYLADRHRAANGSRKTWVVIGAIGIVIACYHLFSPPAQVSTSYYLFWSLAYFLAFTMTEVPHTTWGSELTMNYNQRAQVYGVRTIATKLGILIFYALPLLPLYTTSEYTPAVLKDAIYLGTFLTLWGVLWSLLRAPAGAVTQGRSEDSLKLIMQSLVNNKPLLIYFSAYLCTGLSLGMWFGLLYIYLDSYLVIGEKAATIFTLGTLVSLLSTPLWPRVVRKTSKHATWALGMSFLCLQLLGMLFVWPGMSWWIPLLLITFAYVAFACNSVAALSALGDIIDYGKLKFHKDRGATYFAMNGLMFKAGMGMGSGISLGIAGLFGFDPANKTHSDDAIFGLQLGFIYLPLFFALVSMAFILITPINRRRHRIIERRLAHRLIRQ